MGTRVFTVRALRELPCSTHITGRPLLTSCSCTAGTAEDAQLFNTNYVSRGMGNLRAEVDDLLNRLLTGHLKDEVGHKSKLRSLDQKAALLSALQPADRLRTLGLVCVHSQSRLHVELSVPRATLAHYGWGLSCVPLQGQLSCFTQYSRP